MKFLNNLWKKEPSKDKLREFKCQNFDIILLPHWIELPDDSKEDVGRPVNFYHLKFKNGVIQIWTYTFDFEGDNDFSKAALKRTAIEQLKHKMESNKIPSKQKIKQFERDEHFFVETQFKDKERFWRLWVVVNQKKVAHISYNYQLKHPDVEPKEVFRIVESFRFKKI